MTIDTKRYALALVPFLSSSLLAMHKQSAADLRQDTFGIPAAYAPKQLSERHKQQLELARTEREKMLKEDNSLDEDWVTIKADKDDDDSINKDWVTIEDDLGNNWQKVTHEAAAASHAAIAAKRAVADVVKQQEKTADTVSPTLRAYNHVLRNAQQAVADAAEKRNKDLPREEITIDLPKIEVKLTALELLGQRVQGRARFALFHVNNAFKSFGRWLCGTRK